MMHISNWSARRSGPSMTVHGKADSGDGAAVKLTDIRKIEVRGRLVVAIEGDGDEHILRVD